MKPVCVPCQRFFRPIKTGFYWIEAMPIGNDVQPGLAEPENWKPYKLWSGDKWECPDCYATIISGVGLKPVSEHYMPDFQSLVDATDATLQINDC